MSGWDGNLRRSSDRNRTLRAVGFLAAIGMGASMFFALLVWVLTAVEAVKCEAYGEQTDRTTRYQFLVGCMVQLQDGRWIPRDELRQINRS